jgi:hypothetical protein
VQRRQCEGVDSRAADSLAALAVPLHVLIEENRLSEIPGVGEAIAHIIISFTTRARNYGRKSRLAFSRC